MPELDDWKTALTSVDYGEIAIRGIDIADLIESGSFAQVVSLLFRARKATEEEARVIDGVLVAMSDHGVHAPSTLASRIAASAGTPLQASVAAGVAAVGDHHGGALEGAMRILKRIVDEGSGNQAALEVFEAEREAGRRIPGFGHPYHRPDPRAVALKKLSDRLKVSGRASAALDDLAQVVSKASEGRLLPNADGVAAAVLVDMDFDPVYGRGFFIISRSLGLVAHAVEEETRERPVRTIDPHRVTYDGPIHKESAD